MEIVTGIPSTKQEYEKELARWEQHPSEVTVRAKAQPGNPYTKREFPMMLYRAQRHPQSGKWCVSLVAPSYIGFHDMNEWDRACQFAQVFTAGCQRIVRSEDELKAAIESGEGWQKTQADAMAWREDLEHQVSVAAAERHYSDRKMSDKAQVEASTFERENFGHQAEVPTAQERKHGKEAKRAKDAA
jgi:hypothetical protein